jgi:hypothetical protein
MDARTTFRRRAPDTRTMLSRPTHDTHVARPSRRSRHPQRSHDALAILLRKSLELSHDIRTTPSRPIPHSDGTTRQMLDGHSRNAHTTLTRHSHDTHTTPTRHTTLTRHPQTTLTRLLTVRHSHDTHTTLTLTTLTRHSARLSTTRHSHDTHTTHGTHTTPDTARLSHVFNIFSWQFV